jgi:hypothetical protein
MDDDAQALDADDPEGHDERRGGVRHLACFPAYVETAQGTPRSALIRDLSVTGALLLTRARLQIGDPVKLLLYLSSEGAPQTVSGKVVREERRSIEMAHPWSKQVAIQFDEPVPELESRARELADRQAELLGRKT